MQNTAVVPIAFNLVLIRAAQNKAESEEFYSDGEVLTNIQFRPKPTAFIDVRRKIGDGSGSSDLGEIETDFGGSRTEKSCTN